MEELEKAQLLNLESAVLMFRDDAWPCLVRGLPEPELGTGIARYLNRCLVGELRCHRPPASTTPPCPPLIKP